MPTNRGAPVGVIPSASDSTPSADSGPLLSPSPLASLARSPAEAKCRSIRSSLPRTVVLPSAATIARRGHLYLRTLRTSDALVPLLGDGADSLPCRAKPRPFLPEALNAIKGHLGTPERGPNRHRRNPPSSQTTNGAPLDLFCLSSTSRVNPGLPSSAILAPVEGASEEAQRSRMPLSDWRPSSSAAPIGPPLAAVNPSAPKSPATRHHPPAVTIFRPAHVCRKDTMYG